MRKTLATVIATGTLLLGILAAPVVQAAAAEECRLQLLADLHVEVPPLGAVLVPVKIDGKDVWMMLAMQSGTSMIQGRALPLLGLAEKGITTNAPLGSRVRKQDSPFIAGKKELERYVQIDSLRLGSINFARFEALISLPDQLPMPDFHGTPVVGYLGSSAFKEFDVELNLGAERLRVFRQTTCKEPPVYWGLEFTAVPFKYDPSGTMIFAMELDGKRIQTVLATQRRGSNLDRRTTQRYFGFKADAPELERERLPNGETAAFRAMSLAAEGLSISNAKILLREGSERCDLEMRPAERAIGYGNCFNNAPFAIGTDVLKRLRLIVVGKQDRIYFTKAGGTS